MRDFNKEERARIQVLVDRWKFLQDQRDKNQWRIAEMGALDWVLDEIGLPRSSRP